jgi:hypothetical protein
MDQKVASKNNNRNCCVGVSGLFPSLLSPPLPPKEALFELNGMTTTVWFMKGLVVTVFGRFKDIFFNHKDFFFII